ncbi:DUF11 domain-containing protein [Paenibacillus sonchi]|uniref:DUF11 domain-containing protein n=1 Tax=Paenibacillus sonchi TaxID=373687 RepID=UPI0005843638|nr:DUF11 domain-containing protein [Paenibacillus sonchi]
MSSFLHKEVKIIPLVVRATINATGAITFTGNTLGLSRSDTTGIPGTQDSIGAFATVNTASVFGTYPAGTANLYQNNSSSAILTIPSGSTVLYAELIWGGSYINGSVNLSSAINNPVSFTTPAGTTLSVPPDSDTITGFATPVTGALGGRILFSAQEGDANRSGDQALFGPTSNTQVALASPNNFANNFFASQINNDTGALNTTGTFGTRNQTNGSPGTNIIGRRQGWDITNVDVSARLVNNQSSALLTPTTSGDVYVVNGNALQIDINAPKITLTKGSNVAGTVVGDTVTYTVTVSNTGTASPTSAVLSDTLPTGLTFVNRSVVVAGVVPAFV